VEHFGMPTLSENQQEKNLAKVLKIFERCRAVSSTMPLQHVYTFLAVCLNPGKSVEEIAKFADVGQTVMSRHLRDIGPMPRHQEPGYGLIDLTLDQKDMRRHIYVLTSKGKQLARELAECLA
jgi:DNA-binding MarR family transcriptional regulator